MQIQSTQTLAIQTLQFLKNAQSTKLSLPKRVRALGLMAQELDQILTWPPTNSADGLAALSSALTKIAGLNLGLLLDEATQVVHTQFLPRIRWYRVRVAPIEQLNEAQYLWLRHYFQEQVYPLLTPFAVDPGRPFPFIQDRRLNFLVVLEAKNQSSEAAQYGVVPIPSRLPRLIQAQPCLPPPMRTRNPNPIRCLVWREEIVRYFLPLLFSGVNVKAVYQFRLLRAPVTNMPSPFLTTPLNASMTKGPITQLAVEKTMPIQLRQWLSNRLPVNMERVLACATPLGLGDLCELADYLKPQ